MSTICTFFERTDTPLPGINRSGDSIVVPDVFLFLFHIRVPVNVVENHNCVVGQRGIYLIEVLSGCIAVMMSIDEYEVELITI